MEKGQDGDHLGFGVEQPASPDFELGPVGRDIGMAEHRPLGLARGPAGILLHGDIGLGGDGHRGGRARQRDQLIEGHHRSLDLRFLGFGEVAGLEGFIENALEARQRIGKMAHNQLLDPAVRRQFLGAGKGHLEIEGD